MALDSSVLLGGAILLVMGMICGHTAKTYKNRDYRLWFVLGMLFGLISLIILYIMPAKKKLTEAVQANSTSTKANPSVTNAEALKIANMNPLPMITNQWYYLDSDNTQVGPLSFQRLKDSYLDGTLSDTNYVWNEDLSEWKKLSELPEYLDILKE